MRDQEHSPGERWGRVTPLGRARRLAAIAIPALVLTVACANESLEPSGPTSGSPMPVTPSEQATSAPSTATDLTIVFNNGSGSAVTWRLTCNPSDGTHPDPQAACRALETNGAAALPPVPADKACTQIYGGPQTATVTGTWRGQPVSSTFARNDGCQISRWKLMEGLLPTGGT